jgi:hypothetical protein
MSLKETENYFTVYNSIRNLPPFFYKFFSYLIKNELKKSIQNEISMLMFQANDKGYYLKNNLFYSLKFIIY